MYSNKTKAQTEGGRLTSSVVADIDGLAIESGEREIEQARRDLHVAIARLDAALSESSAQRWPTQSGSGTWDLLDEFRQTGNRYVVLRATSPRIDTLANLSPTERKVIDHTARGLETKGVATALAIAPATVRVLLMRAVHKCGVKNRVELIRLWLSTQENSDG